MKRWSPGGWFVCVVLAVPSAYGAEPSVQSGLQAIKSVAREGAGNEAAAAGWKAVTAAGGEALIPTLTAFRGADPTASNWLRTAVDAIAEKEKQAARPLPIDSLTQFLQDTTQNPDARRIAFELVTEQAPDTAAKLLPTMIDDPSVEIRRDAIAARLKAAESLDAAKKSAEYSTLFTASRDKDQAEELKKLLGKSADADLTKHFGYITEWQVVGPFDSTENIGFTKSYPPEAGVNLGTKYPSKDGSEVGWKPVMSAAAYGTIDLNVDLDKHKDACAYAFATLVSEKETPAEIRLNTPNSVVVFLNGKKVYEHDEYHHGDRFDQFSAPVALKAGKNEVLLKLCQNDQKEPWAQKWQFALRFCDATGGALPLKQIIVRDGIESTVAPGAIKPIEKKEDSK